ncbi:MAG TPA: formate C-acetyltransferase [Victivallales bacterium]|nr:formate C-acetyltransferase [Victivallales bacterium]
MKRRIIKLLEHMFRGRREISLERALLYTESYKKTEEEPVIIRRAKATSHILENVNISIRDNEIIVGNRTEKPRSGIISPEMDPYWINEELNSIENRSQDPFYISEKNKTIYKEQLFTYWKGKSLKDFIITQITPDIKEAVGSRIVNLNQTDKGQGHIIADFEKIITNGLQQVIDQVEYESDKKADNLFLRASLICLKASQNHILRYSKLASEYAEHTEDKVRKHEFELISSACQNVASKRPNSFYEACQLLWFLCIILQYESNASSLSLGRFDQYMYPYFKTDLESGIELDYLKEILEIVYIKTNDVVLIRSSDSAKFFAGFPTGYTMLLGGLTESGKSAVNKLSFLCLDAYADIKLPQPNIGVRINEFIERDFLLKATEVISLGTGIPQIFNDEVIIPSFLNRGVSLEDARDYSVVGCVELSIPGKTYGLHDIAMLNLVKIMECILSKHKNNNSISYDLIEENIKNSITHYVKLMIDGSNIVDSGHRKYAPTPLLSSFIEGCIDRGLDINEGGAKYNFSGVQGIGISNLCDSLYVLKKMIFEEKRLNFKDYIEKLEQNYPDEESRINKIRAINKYDKYGNDCDEVDSIGSDILRYYCKEIEKYKNVRGGRFIPGSYTVSAHVPLGAVVGATPDGRSAGEQLADGGLSPMTGRDRLGPTAVLKSLSKLDNYLLTNGSLLNVKFTPQTLQCDNGKVKLADFLMAFLKLKIQHIQFNILDSTMLKDAQKHPEEYSSLVVRVAGYSAFFNELSIEIQNDIINRTAHIL